ncbi:Ureidoglycolate lyase [Orbilia blumenaviensis]|uniref:Ureidoglycolate lyase n=1 Tax=Orbilia blumenaviensis TaxID=1796055 RepID=A0AAV9VJB2_9PEZI
MPHYKSSPAASISIPVSPLNPSSFSPFGTVIENPRSAPTSATVNQGTAEKYPEITPFVSYPPPSGKPSSGKLNLFVCNPRKNLGDDSKTFTVHILERHPYTTQTFIPVGLDRNDSGRKYLVIVAPTLDLASDGSSGGSGGLKHVSRPPPYPVKEKKRVGIRGSPPYPVPQQTPVEVDISKANYSAPDTSGTTKPKGRGLPDLSNIQAFMCRGDQAVTYGVGTWHAPMVVLGDGPVEFVVVMHENGVAVEDCEECEIEGGRVTVDIGDAAEGAVKAKL